MGGKVWRWEERFGDGKIANSHCLKGRRNGTVAGKRSEIKRQLLLFLKMREIMASLFAEGNDPGERGEWLE